MLCKEGGVFACTACDLKDALRCGKGFLQDRKDGFAIAGGGGGILAGVWAVVHGGLCGLCFEQVCDKAERIKEKTNRLHRQGDNAR